MAAGARADSMLTMTSWGRTSRSIAAVSLLVCVSFAPSAFLATASILPLASARPTDATSSVLASDSK